MQLYRQLNSLFNRRERWQLGILAVALIVRAGVEMVGVGSIAPFMSVVADPSGVQENQWLRWAYEAFGFTSTTAFLTALGMAVVVVLAVSNAFSALALWGMLRFSYGMHHRLSNRLFRSYLAQPYSFFVERNSASFSKTILTEVMQVIQGVMTPVLNITARSLVVVALVGLLIVLDPMLAMVIVLVLGGVYGGLYTLVRTKQRRLGRERVAANQERFKVTGEAFGGIKDVKVLGREDAFVSRFAPASWTYSKATASNAVIAQLPRYLFETIAFGGIVLIVLYYLQAGQGLAQILPTISLYAFAGYRLMPELQQLFGGVAAIRFNRAALDDLTDDLGRFALAAPVSDTRPLPFTNAISFEDVTFRYARADRPALDGVVLTIPHNQTIGLVGASGSGKTTLVDMLLGLYTPEAGRILVDDTPLTAGISALGDGRWGTCLSTFSCAMTRSNTTSPSACRKPRWTPLTVERAARIAHLHDFIRTLPDGYATIVGERGVRLSGGQRQRIGIARALYHDPDVLIMDEATSALDGVTEEGVMGAIRDLSGRKTIVLIAHRLTTVRSCDTVYLLEEGSVSDQGTLFELADRNDFFRDMVKLQEPVG